MTFMSECCMCGDYDLFEQLFQSRLCLFRSQHRYCSNVYSKAKTYNACNWCLHKEGSSKNASNSSSSNNKKKRVHSEVSSNKKKKRAHLEVMDGGDHIKSSPKGSPRRRKRIITKGRLKDILRVRRTKSDGRDGAVTKQVFRNHIRKNMSWWDQILNPGSEFVSRWNPIFLVTCTLALFVDPLYFFLPRNPQPSAPLPPIRCRIQRLAISIDII